MTSNHSNLQTLEGFLGALQKCVETGRSFYGEGSCFCPGCGDMRVVSFRAKHSLRVEVPSHSTVDPSSIALEPFTLDCSQCGTKFTAMVYAGPSGWELFFSPDTQGTHATPNTPDGVAYYLDQAARAETAGAKSAAVAMYRGALEQLLFERGFEAGTLRKKIAAGFDPATGKFLSLGLEKEFFEVIKDLGNGSVHPNDGDVKKQRVLDGAILADLHTVFARLLMEIYELPAKRQAQLAALKGAAAKLKP